MMRVICKIVLLLFIISALLVSNAAAAPLPISTYAETENNWQGSKEYKEEGLYVRVDFAVYDTDNLQRTGETELAELLDVDGQYIYAYQIFSHSIESVNNVEVFQLANLDGTALDVTLTDIGSYDDDSNGIAPIETSSEGVWEFSGIDPALAPGEHSWFLVFSYDLAPIAGNYKVETFSSDDPVPPPIPEPATVAFLGMGLAMLLTKRLKWDRR